MAKAMGCTVVFNNDENKVELYVRGDMLPDSVYLELLAMIKEYRGKKELVFIADNPKMLLLIRESIPSECIDKLELRRYEDPLQVCKVAV